MPVVVVTPHAYRTQVQLVFSPRSSPCQVQLSNFDLFHAHLVVVRPAGELLAVALLFHAKEYPRYSPTVFPYHLGYCQQASTLEYSTRAMDLRNFLWLQVGGVLMGDVVLPGAVWPQVGDGCLLLWLCLIKISTYFLPSYQSEVEAKYLAYLDS